MTRRRRNQLCIFLVLLGLANIIAFCVAYSYIGGDAWNGGRDDGAYFVKGHFVRNPEGQATSVTRATWVYSYLHSITFWPSLAAIVLSMLVLARPHIIATCRDGPVSGGTLIAVIGTTVSLVTAAGTAMLVMDFVRLL